MFSRIMEWLSEHRYIFGMMPKDWNDEKEAEYQRWAWRQPNADGYQRMLRLDPKYREPPQWLK